MKKISIVSERNEETNAYEIRTIVIFSDDKKPVIINYEGVQDLMAVVNFAENNGFDILAEAGIKPAVDGGLIEIISKSNEKRMAELKAEIYKEELKFASKEKEEQQQMTEAVDKELEELKDNKKLAKKTRKVLPKEFQNLADYLFLDQTRATRELTEEEQKELENLLKDERVAGLERARENLLDAEKEFNLALEEDKKENRQEESDRTRLARRNFKAREADYFELYDTYRKELAKAMKEAPTEEVMTEEEQKNNEQPKNNEQENGSELPEEYKNLFAYFVLSDRHAELTEREKKILEEVKKDKRVAKLVEAKEKLDKAIDAYNNAEFKSAEEAKTASELLKKLTKEYNELYEKSSEELNEALIKAIKEEDKEYALKNGIITADTTMFKPAGLDLEKEDREFAEYLKLNMLRAKKQLPPVGLRRIEDLTTKNDRVQGLEKARANVIAAAEKLNRAIEEDKKANLHEESDKTKLARLDLKARETDYENLHTEYRKQLAEAIKKATRIEDKQEEARENQEIPEEKKPTNGVDDPTKKGETPPRVPSEFKREVVKLNAGNPENKDLIVPPTGPDKGGNGIVPPTGPDKGGNGIVPPAGPDKGGAGIVPPTGPDKGGAGIVPPTGPDKGGAGIVPPTVPEKFRRETVRGTGDEKKTEPDKKETGIRLLTDGKEKKAEGITPVKKGEIKKVTVPTGKGGTETVTVKTTGKLKALLKKVGAFVIGLVAGALSALGITSIIDRFSSKGNNNTKTPVATPTNTVKPTQTQTAAPTPTVNIVNNTTITPIILDYCQRYNVPEATKNFLQSKEVMEFLSKYKNEDQIREVISALAYGYEANILTTKDGNYRLDADGNNYLSSFTHDFLCAKAIVNRYSGRQMLTVFGGSNISYEELTSGFKNYCYTVSNYGMTGKEPLPFRYLTNNNSKSTQALNELQDKLIVVNQNREAGTLTSDHTDDFIATVFEIYVQNDQSLALSEGAKTVGAALVDSFAAMQAQIDNGEALFLHKDMGLAKAGIHLGAQDGHFTVGYLNQDTYNFTSLYDVMNHGYGDKDENAARCLTQQQELLAAINTMHTLNTSSADTARVELANALRNNLFTKYGDLIMSGNFTQKDLDEIAVRCPIVHEQIEAYRYAVNNNGSEYVEFEQTVEGVDKLLGLQNRKVNNYAALINARRTPLANYSSYRIISGTHYADTATATVQPPVVNTTTATPTPKPAASLNPGNGATRTRTTTTTTTKTEQVPKSSLNPQEQQSAQKQEDQIRAQEQQQAARIEEGKAALRQGVKNGKSQAELEAIAKQYGIDSLDPNYQAAMKAALEAQKRAEEDQKRIQAEVEARNKKAEEEARKRQAEEEEQQRRAKEEQDKLIRQSQGLEDPDNKTQDGKNPGGNENPGGKTQDDQGGSKTPVDPQLDPDRKEPGEIPYEPSASVKNELNLLRRAATAALGSDVDVDDLGLGDFSGPKLG